MKALNLLIVEDSSCQANYLAELCHASGLSKLTFAENGRVAFELIQQSKTAFDIIVCDLEMPEVDGIELIHWLAQNKSRAALIIVSSREQSLVSAVELMALTLGLDVLGAIRKPIPPLELEKLLRQYKDRAPKGKKKQSDVRATLTTEDINTALELHQFVLHYQPKLFLDNGMLNGLEALVRLQHPQAGLYYPSDFIGICEQNGLIDRLSLEVITMALKQLTEWNQQGFAPKISVNLSGRSFANTAFMQNVMQLITHTVISPSDFIFEVTETEVISNLGDALAFFTRLRLYGFGLAIDDYGTGYSSVKQLSQIPFNELKMDRSLIDGIATKPHLQVIFESTLSMCNKLAIDLVAEGVEKDKDWEFLKSTGCHIAQGYYISPPMPSYEIVNWVHAGMPVLNGLTERVTI